MAQGGAKIGKVKRSKGQKIADGQRSFFAQARTTKLTPVFANPSNKTAIQKGPSFVKCVLKDGDKWRNTSQVPIDLPRSVKTKAHNRNFMPSRGSSAETSPMPLSPEPRLGEFKLTKAPVARNVASIHNDMLEHQSSISFKRKVTYDTKHHFHHE